MELEPHIQQTRDELKDVEAKLASFDFSTSGSNPATEDYQKLSQRHAHLSRILQSWEKLEKAQSDLKEAEELAETEEDQEMLDVAQQEIEKQQKAVQQHEREIKQLLLPSSYGEQRNPIVEIRPAAGGEEASLFAADLFRMYTRLAEAMGWKYETLNVQETEVGGVKEVVFSIKGEDAYKMMRFESGVHRVQRVPVTESSGRIHTSTVTVAVLPEAEEVELNIQPQDLRTDVFRASGPGGQSVNTTDSAVRLTHIPTGIVVSCQKEKSQHRNREIAHRIMRSRLLEKKRAEEEAKNDADRRNQLGSGERSERIRTYNFPQNRVSDHRFNITRYDLHEIIEGHISDLLNQIVDLAAERALQETSP